MWSPVEQEDEDIDCSEAEQFALPNSDTRHQSFIKTAQNTRTNEALSNQKCAIKAFSLQVSQRWNLPRLSCWLFKETNKKQFIVYKVYIYEADIIYSIMLENHLVAAQRMCVSCFACAYQLAFKRMLIWSQLIFFTWSSASNVTSL